jgi:hypothetical protein
LDRNGEVGVGGQALEVRVVVQIQDADRRRQVAGWSGLPTRQTALASSSTGAVVTDGGWSGGCADLVEVGYRPAAKSIDNG